VLVQGPKNNNNILKTFVRCSVSAVASASLPLSTSTAIRYYIAQQTGRKRIYSPRNVSGGCKCRPISVKQNLIIEASELLYVTMWSLIKFCVISFYILFRGYSNPQNMSLVMVLQRRDDTV